MFSIHTTDSFRPVLQKVLSEDGVMGASSYGYASYNADGIR